MKRGNPRNIHIFDRDIIPIRLSFNQIKYMLDKLRFYRTDSVEGQVCIHMVEGLRKYLKGKNNEGNLDPLFVDMLSNNLDDLKIPKTGN